MIRRYEIYSLDPNAEPEKVAALKRAVREGSKYIPDLRHCAVGHNRTDCGLDLVWEHAYPSIAAYRRYMEHHFHANVFDRYLMNDCPERIIIDNDLDAILAGYTCDRPDYYLASGGARRLLFLRLREGAASVLERITETAMHAEPRMILSVFAENSMATRWADGTTVIRPPAIWTHIWEQGYASLADAEASKDWRDSLSDALIERSIELCYELETGFGYGDPISDDELSEPIGDELTL
jgi:hypothetical protein